MTRCPALSDGEDDAYGVTFLDLPGIVAMDATVDEAWVNAEEALRDYERVADLIDSESRRRRIAQAGG